MRSHNGSLGQVEHVGRHITQDPKVDTVVVVREPRVLPELSGCVRLKVPEGQRANAEQMKEAAPGVVGEPRAQAEALPHDSTEAQLRSEGKLLHLGDALGQSQQKLALLSLRHASARCRQRPGLASAGPLLVAKTRHPIPALSLQSQPLRHGFN